MQIKEILSYFNIVILSVSRTLVALGLAVAEAGVFRKSLFSMFYMVAHLFGQQTANPAQKILHKLCLILSAKWCPRFLQNPFRPERVTHPLYDPESDTLMCSLQIRCINVNTLPVAHYRASLEPWGDHECCLVFFIWSHFIEKPSFEKLSKREIVTPGSNPLQASAGMSPATAPISYITGSAFSWGAPSETI